MITCAIHGDEGVNPAGKCDQMEAAFEQRGLRTEPLSEPDRETTRRSVRRSELLLSRNKQIRHMLHLQQRKQE